MKATSANAILIIASFLSSVCCLAQTKSKEAAAYANSGIAKLKKNDLNGAIADFNRALQLDPKLAKVYTDRGLAKAARGQWDGAIADYNRALQLDPKLADAYYNRGLAKTHRHELVTYGGVDTSSRNYQMSKSSELGTAFADFNRALQLDPKNADVYHARGIAKLERGDRDGAITDFNNALRLNPKDSKAYDTRGLAKQFEGDLEGAIADYNHSLQLDPKNFKAYCNRGAAKVESGDSDGAIADLNRSLQLNPKDALAYNERGRANFLARNWTAALRDYRRFCELSSRNQEYPRLFIWVIQSRLGEREAADKELAAHFDAVPGGWPSKIQKYLLGNLSESEFLTAAASSDAKTDRGSRCEGYFYAGMKNLLDSNKTAATGFFKKCVATGQKAFIEYTFGKAELKALEQ